jgi:hypothetical protein
MNWTIKMNKRIRFYIGLAVIGMWIIFPPASTATEWNLNSYSNDLHQIFKFEEKLYIYKTSHLYSPTHLLRSPDGEKNSWEAIYPIWGYFPAERFFMKSHKGDLYAFINSPPAGGVQQKEIRRSPNGSDWDQVYSQTDSDAYCPFVDAIGMGDDFYVVDLCGTILKGSGKGNPLTWTTIDAPPGLDIAQYGSLFIFKGALHLTNLRTNRTLVYRMNGTEQWDPTPVVDVDWVAEHGIHAFAIRFAVSENRLYLGQKELWYTEGNTSPKYEWEKFEFFQWGPVIPAIINNRLHVWSVNNPILMLNDQGTWEKVSSLTSMIVYSVGLESLTGRNDVVELGTNHFVEVQGDLWKLKIGMTGLDNEFSDQNTLFSSQQRESVMRLKIRANISDRIKFSVINKGTAVQGRDIERVWLVNLTEADNKNGEVIGEFIVDGQTDQKWNLQKYVEVDDGDSLAVAVDVAAAPFDGATCAFSVEPGDLFTTYNDGFELLGPLNASPVQIKNIPAAPGTEPISEVLIYPQPAQNEVRFLYDLAAAATITIRVYDPNGDLVGTVNDSKPQGDRQFTSWNSSHIASGMYYATIQITSAAGDRLIKRQVFIKR